jgi:excisionase family DNA binding protein
MSMTASDVPILTIQARSRGPAESLPSLLVRNAEANFHLVPTRLLVAAGLVNVAVSDLSTNRKAIRPLARLFGLPEAELARMSYAAPDDGRQLMGHAIHPEFVSSQHRRVCPQCLKEDRYHRAVWDLSLMTVCPVHLVWLVERCPSCRQRPRWVTSCVTACHCGADLRSVRTAAVPESELAGATAVHRLLHTPPDHLKGLGAEIGASGILRLIYVLGAYELGVDRRQKPLAFAKAHPDRAHLVLNAGWRACSDWPTSFHVFLDRLRKAGGVGTSKASRYGVEKSFGRLPYWLWTVSEEPFGKVAIDAFSSYVAADPTFATRAHAPRLKRATAPNGSVTLHAASRMLNVAHDTLLPFAKSQGLIIAGGGGKGAPVLLRTADVSKLQETASGLLNQSQAIRFLGIAKNTFRDLKDAGLLPSPADEPAAKLAPGPVWRREDLRAFVLRFEQAMIAGRKPVETVSLTSVAQALSSLGFGMDVLIRALLKGRLCPIGLKGPRPGLGRLEFRKSDVEAFRATLVKTVRKTLSIPEASERLGAKQECVYHWVRQGLLPTVRVPGKRAETGRRIREDDLVAFRHKYVTATWLADMGIAGGKHLGGKLVALGVKPVSGPGVDGGRQFLFQCDDVEHVFDRLPRVEGRQSCVHQLDRSLPRKTASGR